jgi:cation:H+ antiporter
MAYAGAVILSAAEPFALSLIAVGRAHGISEFFLIQWLAPLASETPELVIACSLSLRAKGDKAMGVLLSSKVNQWTLLVGTLPIAYTASSWAHGRGAWSLPLDGRQVEELFLTAAQALMAVAIVSDLSIRRWEAAILFGLFAVQFPFESSGVRVGLGVTYLAIGVVILLAHRERIPHLIEVLRRKAPAHPATPPS